MTKPLQPASREDVLFIIGFALRKHARPSALRQPDWQRIVAAQLLDHMTTANLVVMQGPPALPPRDGYGTTLEEQARERREEEQARAAHRGASPQG